MSLKPDSPFSAKISEIEAPPTACSITVSLSKKQYLSTFASIRPAVDFPLPIMPMRKMLVPWDAAVRLAKGLSDGGRQHRAQRARRISKSNICLQVLAFLLHRWCYARCDPDLLRTCSPSSTVLLNSSILAARSPSSSCKESSICSGSARHTTIRVRSSRGAIRPGCCRTRSPGARRATFTCLDGMNETIDMILLLQVRFVSKTRECGG